MEERKTHTPPRRAGMGRRPIPGEKAKDLVGTWKKLFKYCDKYVVIIIISLLCAIFSTVLTLKGPDMLSDMTDTITKGIAPDEDAFTEVSTLIGENLYSENPSDIKYDGAIISLEDQMKFMEVVSTLDPEDEDAALEALKSLPKSVQNAIYKKIDMDKVTKIGLLLVAMYALSWLFSLIQGQSMATVTQKVTKRMRGDISVKINKLPM